MLKNADYDN